jgi:hypothetical protein
MLIVPSVSRRTVKGNSPVVVIDVDRGERGRDDGTRKRLWAQDGRQAPRA